MSVVAAMENNMAAPQRLNIELSFDPAISLLDVDTRELCRDSNTCTPVFIAALFIIAKRSRQPKCFSEEECINKMWYMGISFSLKKKWRDSPGGPVAKTLCSQGRGPGVLSLLVGELDPCAKAKSLHAATKKKNKNPVCCVLCAVKTRCSQKKKKEIKFQHRLRYGWTLIK